MHFQMATKDNCLSFNDKQMIFVDNNVGNQFNNLNLNQTNKRILDDVVTKSVDLKADKNDNSYGATSGVVFCQKRRDLVNSKKIQGQCFPASTDDQKGQTLCKNSSNSSTLSLHIAAYENSIEIADDSKSGDVTNVSSRDEQVAAGQLKKKKESAGGSGIQNSFEFPRQQKDVATNPEVMQFKASQKLLNPNSSPASRISEPATPADIQSSVVSQSNQPQQLHQQQIPQQILPLPLVHHSYLEQLSDGKYLTDLNARHLPECLPISAQAKEEKRQQNRAKISLDAADANVHEDADAVEEEDDANEVQQAQVGLAGEDEEMNVDVGIEEAAAVVDEKVNEQQEQICAAADDVHMTEEPEINDIVSDANVAEGNDAIRGNEERLADNAGVVEEEKMDVQESRQIGSEARFDEDDYFSVHGDYDDNIISQPSPTFNPRIPAGVENAVINSDRQYGVEDNHVETVTPSSAPPVHALQVEPNAARLNDSRLMEESPHEHDTASVPRPPSPLLPAVPRSQSPLLHYTIRPEFRVVQGFDFIVDEAGSQSMFENSPWINDD